MSLFQLDETYLDSTDVLRGNATVEISPYQATPSYTNIGAIINVSIQRNLETTEEQTDNSPGDQRIYKEIATLSLTRCEALNTAVSESISGDSDTYANVAGSLVEGGTQTIAANWTNLQTYELSGQNSDGTVPTINSVTASVSGALAAEDDYFITRGANGLWTIAFDTGGSATVATSESIVIDSDYTPAASTTITWATGKVLTKFIVRLTFNNQGARAKTVVLYKCQLEARDAVSLAADDAEDPRYLEPLTITCMPDGLYNSDAVGLETINAS